MTHQTASGDSGSLERRTVLKTIGASVGAAAVGASASASASAAAGSYTGEDYNGRYYGKYVPSTVDGSSAVPLVLMMHGCTQSADGFKDESKMNQVAEEHGFIVVYPEENQGTNECWNWWDDSHTTRGSGQAAEMVGICDQVKANHTIDDERVYAVGFSAGAAFVPNLGVEYADYFAAVGVHSGLNYDVVETKTDGNMAMSQCSNGKTPAEAGQQAYDRMADFGITRKTPQVVFHGTDDYTVYTCNGKEAAERATVTCDLVDDGSDDGSCDYTADSTTTVSGSSSSATLTTYQDGDGDPVVEQYIVDGMGHAWAGGASGGSYTAPGAPSASQHIWDFCSQWTLSGHGNTDDGSGGNSAPTADVSASSSTVSTGEAVTLDGAGSSDSDGSIASYEWDLGDGTTATGQSVAHSYSSTGDYTVTLTVTDDDGASDSASTTVSVTSDGSFDGYCGEDSNYDHVQAGRAYTEGSYAYADGSGQEMGLNNTYTNTTLEETSEGYYEIVDSCGDSGGGDDGGDDGGSWWNWW